MPSQIAGSPPEGLPEPTGGTSHRAGLPQPRRRGERRTRYRAPATLVDAVFYATADAASIPAVSTSRVRRLGFQSGGRGVFFVHGCLPDVPRGTVDPHAHA